MLAATPRIRVGAVSYLNTVPLIWGMLHGEQSSAVCLSHSIPSICAERLEKGEDEIGLVPVAEIARQNLQIVSDFGIACDGAVRSILLFSRTPIRAIRNLAVDESSRTSVQLARIILRERYGTVPSMEPARPNLQDMMKHADAALIIGDPALRLEPAQLPWNCLDLGAEWQTLTGLPMVFATWAAKEDSLRRDRLQHAQAVLHDSMAFGRMHLKEIVSSEAQKRAIDLNLADEYLTARIRYDVGKRERQGLQTFYELAGLRTAAVC